MSAIPDVVEGALIGLCSILAAVLLLTSTLAVLRGFLVQDAFRGAAAPWRGTRHAMLAREAVARVLFAAMSPLAWVSPILPRTCQGVPVVLVPDPHVGRASMFLLALFFRQRGRCVWAIPCRGTDMALAERAERLERAIRRRCEAMDVPVVDVVAFGLGGLAAAWMVRHRDGAAFVRRLVTLGTPWRGTRMAAFYTGHAHLEAAPESHDLDALLPPAVPTLSIWCPDDPEVVPADHACAEDVRSLAIEGAGHLGLLLSARTFRAVLHGLDEPLPEAA